MGRRAVTLDLTEAGRAGLSALATRRSTAQALAQRARIVLACAEGMQNKDVAVGLKLDVATAAKWRRRFAEHRVDGLRDEPR
ncbi:MAG: helix-turn-helix domain-containing protein, partial [Janthinobacterium lividum]